MALPIAFTENSSWFVLLRARPLTSSHFGWESAFSSELYCRFFSLWKIANACFLLCRELRSTNFCGMTFSQQWHQIGKFNDYSTSLWIFSLNMRALRLYWTKKKLFRTEKILILHHLSFRQQMRRTKWIISCRQKIKLIQSFWRLACRQRIGLIPLRWT